MAISKDKFRESINEFYSKEILFRLYTKYFLDWIAEGYIGSNLGLFEISMIGQNTNKQTFLDLIEQFYSKEEVFITILEKLDPNIKNIFTYLAWNEHQFFIPTDEKEKYFKMENNYDLTRDLKDEYLFFRIDKDKVKGEYLYLDYDIIRVIRKFMKKPKEYNIQVVDTVQNLSFNNNENEIVQNLKMYFKFYQDNGIKLSNSSKILKASKVNMKKYCEITEYYETSKDLDYLKTETLALFFELGKEEYLNEEYFQITNIKNIVQNFITAKYIKEENYHYSSLFLNYLKGVKNIWKSPEKLQRTFQTIGNIIKEIPDDNIVSIDNIVKAILYRDEFIEIIDPKDAYDYIYINEANYERAKILTYDRYINYIAIPFIKTVFFILSVLGVFEVYYDYPSTNNSLYLKNRYLSKFDGIKFIKFTGLGKYCFGRSESYDFKNIKEDGKVILDNTYLIATVVGDVPIQVMFLQRLAQKISDNKYKFSKEIFIKGATGAKEIKERIQEFYSKIDAEPPQIWQEFFNEILDKSTSINAENDFVVLKIKNDKSLIQTISCDKRFKPLLLKGEDYHLLVKTENISEIISLFKEYGYYVNF